MNATTLHPTRPAGATPLAVFALTFVVAGCGPIVRYDEAGRPVTGGWRGGPATGGYAAMDVRANSVDGRVYRGTASVARRSSAAAVQDDASPAGRRTGAAPSTEPRVPTRAAPTTLTPRVHADAGDAGDAADAPAPRRTPAAPATSTERTPAPESQPEVIGAAGSIRLVHAAPAHLPLELGVLAQRANIDDLLASSTAPAEVQGLDVPSDALVNAWAADPVELMLPRGGGGILVQFGAAMPHEVDGSIVGRLRDRGWLAIDVRSVAQDPGRLAGAVTAACDALDALGAAVHDPSSPATERPLVLLGFGEGIAEALTVLEHGHRQPAAVVIISRPDADPMAVQRIDQSLSAARVPVLHLRSTDAVGGSASIRDLVTRGGLEDVTAPAPGLTGWTYARRPGPGIAWLPMLVEPVVNWVGRATDPPDGVAASSRTASARP